MGSADGSLYALKTGVWPDGYQHGDWNFLPLILGVLIGAFVVVLGIWALRLDNSKGTRAHGKSVNSRSKRSSKPKKEGKENRRDKEKTRSKKVIIGIRAISKKGSSSDYDSVGDGVDEAREYYGVAAGLYDDGEESKSSLLKEPLLGSGKVGIHEEGKRSMV